VFSIPTRIPIFISPPQKIVHKGATKKHGGKEKIFAPLRVTLWTIFIGSWQRSLRHERLLLKTTYIKGADSTQARPVVFVQKPDYYLVVEDWRWAPIVRYHPAKSNHEV
jgi:hypothetical protein